MTLRIVHTFLDVAVFPPIYASEVNILFHVSKYLSCRNDGGVIFSAKFKLTRPSRLCLSGAGRDICVTFSLAGNNIILRNIC